MDCEKIKLKLQEAIGQIKQFDELLKEYSGDAKELNELKINLDKVLKEAEFLVDRHDIQLRRELAKKTGAKYIGVFHDGLAKAEKGVDVFFIKKDGSRLDWQIKEEVIAVRDFCDGIAFVYTKKQKWMPIDTNGEYIIGENGYEDIRSFVEGVIFVKCNKDNLWRFMDKSGTLSVKGFKKATDFTEGLAMVKDDNGWFVIDKKEKEITTQRFKEALPFSDGLSAVKDEEGWFFIDKTGTSVITGPYLEAHSFKGGVSAVKKEDEKWYLIDKSGKEINSVSYKSIGFTSEGLIDVEDENGAYFIDKSGKKYGNKIFKEVKWFSEGLAPVKDNKGWYFIDKQEKEITKERFKEAEVFKGRFALVEENEKYAFVDHHGNRLIVRDHLRKEANSVIIATSNFNYAESFEGGVAKIIVNKHVFYIDRTGKVVFGQEWF